MKREKNGVERVSIKKKIKFVVFFFFSQRRFVVLQVLNKSIICNEFKLNETKLHFLIIHRRNESKIETKRREKNKNGPKRE